MVSPSSSILAGLGEISITPISNMQMCGFAKSQVSTGTHDDLYARALAVESPDGGAAIMMTLGLVGFQGDYCQRMREEISDKTGVPVAGIVISVTHTHAGPDVDNGGTAYQDYLIKQAVTAAVTAWGARKPGRIGVGSIDVLELGRNRRRLLYGGIHPDPETAVIRIDDSDGKLSGVAFNYACHPSGLDWQNTLFSEDWPYYAIKGMKDHFGSDVWAAYFQGAMGDINVGYSAELSAVGVDMPVRSYWYMEVKGKQMADALTGVVPGIETTNTPVVAVTSGVFDYPMRQTFPVTLEQARSDAEDAKKRLGEMEAQADTIGSRHLDHARVDVFQASQRLAIAEKFYAADTPPLTRRIEQQAVRIGDAVFVTIPGEVFSEIGKAIKDGSPAKKTFVIGLVNTYWDYMPTAREYAEGDYEVDASPYSPEAGQVCVDSALELIRKVWE